MAIRLGPLLLRRRPVARGSGLLPSLTVVIPARNEERNILACLRSLPADSFPGLQIIVVDDRSADRTAELSRAVPGVEVISAPPAPEGWVGKAWACSQGARHALGKYILFTDADVTLDAAALREALVHALEAQAGLTSAIPYHLAPRAWEDALGFFHVLTFCVLAPFRTPTAKSGYATGQFLLFERACYDAIGGHRAVRSEVVEDVAFARLAAGAGARVVVLPWPRVFSVRLYETPGDFFRGWRRNCGEGFRSMRPLAFLEVLLVVSAVLPTSAVQMPIFLAALALAWAIMRRMGRFSLLSVACIPIAVLAFALISTAAAWDRALRRPVVWRGRSYRADRVRDV